jgi:transposase
MGAVQYAYRHIGKQKSGSHETAEKHMRASRLATGKRYSAEDNICIVLEGLRSENNIAASCLREGIFPTQPAAP